MLLFVLVACLNLALGFAFGLYFPLGIAECQSTASRPEPAEKRQQRATPRFAVQDLQRIAPIQDGQLPATADFCEVRCSDVSASGFSFIVPDRPEYDELVAEFAMSSETAYLRARIRNRTPIGPIPEPGFRVGCEFTERLDWQPA